MTIARSTAEDAPARPSDAPRLQALLRRTTEYSRGRAVHAASAVPCHFPLSVARVIGSRCTRRGQNMAT
eukprot:365014-Chlamydomonas_euryale.AAC.4